MLLLLLAGAWYFLFPLGDGGDGTWQCTHHSLYRAENAERWRGYLRERGWLDDVPARIAGGVFAGSARKLLVFTGSSSIVGWRTLAADFPGYDTLNRGFGGSTFLDLNYWLDALVLKHAPDLVVVYEGDNDLCQGHSLSTLLTWHDETVRLLNASLPRTPVIFVSPKPCPDRARLRAEYLAATLGIGARCAADQPPPQAAAASAATVRQEYLQLVNLWVGWWFVRSV